MFSTCLFVNVCLMYVRFYSYILTSALFFTYLMSFSGGGRDLRVPLPAVDGKTHLKQNHPCKYITARFITHMRHMFRPLSVYY